MNKTKNISEFTLDVVANAHRCWIRDNQSSTLIELYSYLLSVESVFDCFDDEERVIDHIDEFNEEADHYVRQFEELEFDCGLPVTFQYRRDNLDEDIDHVQELIEEAGVSFAISELVPHACLDRIPAE